MAYSVEKNVQILIYLMKKKGIKKVIASPGTTNVALVISVQNDPYFEVYSCVDERSAAYMACGMASESGEPVVLSCTGATASRNYLPGLTEAYYRKLPVIAVTSAQPNNRIGHNLPQIIDRTTILNDIAKKSFQIPIVNDEESMWETEVKINEALIEAVSEDKGPIHINLTSAFENSNEVETLPEYREIKRICYYDEIPNIEVNKIAIFIGNHEPFSEELTRVIDEFCELYNGVVFYDHTSKYEGKYGVLFNLISYQEQFDSKNKYPDLLIDLGEVSGSYMRFYPKEVWRVSIDGKIKDTYRKLTHVFKITEIDFFKRYIDNRVNEKNSSYYLSCKQEREWMLSQIPALPFSNLWIAQNLSSKMPRNSVLHLAILNSLRSWNYFDINEKVAVYTNTGGFGIDGGVSTLIGASLASPDKHFFGIVGDLAFFYDMNSLGNRHLGKNIHLMIINNGKGTEFRNYSHMAHKFGDSADRYIAAAGHFGNQSADLVKHYVQDLGLDYISASNKEEFDSLVESFLDCRKSKSIVFEVFTNSDDESYALKLINNAVVSRDKAIKKMVKNIIGENTIKTVKGILKK